MHAHARRFSDGIPQLGLITRVVRTEPFQRRRHTIREEAEHVVRRVHMRKHIGIVHARILHVDQSVALVVPADLACIEGPQTLAAQLRRAVCSTGPELTAEERYQLVNLDPGFYELSK